MSDVPTSGESGEPGEHSGSASSGRGSSAFRDPAKAPAGVTDRVAGVALVLLGIGVAADASTFEVAFLTDPVGPKALPYLAAVIFVVCGGLLAVRPGAPRSWPRRAVLLRMAGAVTSFGVYAAMLQPLGFVVATTLTVSALSVLFGGPWKRSLASAVALSALLWYLFVWGLGLPLPMGAVWRAVASAAGVTP